MTIRSVVISSYEAYLEFEYPASSPDASDEARAADIVEREARLSRFPYPIMLELAVSEMDFASRWCWESFGPADGECDQLHSEYRACDILGAHSHRGPWMKEWFTKTDYDFGFNEWYFVEESHRDRFRDRVPLFHRGEHYPK